LANERSIVVQFEDFKNPFPALERYQDKFCCFNDDIQGTGAVILGGIINALKRTGISVKDQRAVFMGAGSAGVGVAKQIVEYFMKEGLTEDEARRKFWFVDTKVGVKTPVLEKIYQLTISGSHYERQRRQTCSAQSLLLSRR
jgi:malate dehydrogenase (oxaloacetate-decarboxylating)(NADP+)